MVKDRFIEYVRAMFPLVREAYGNPPELVRLVAPLQVSVRAGVPPADIGDDWWNICRAIFISCIRWEGIERIMPTVDDLVAYVNKHWDDK